MMKKICALMLSAVMAFGAVVGTGALVPERVDAAGELLDPTAVSLKVLVPADDGGIETKYDNGTPDGAIKAKYKEVTGLTPETALEIGDTLYIGITLAKDYNTGDGDDGQLISLKGTLNYQIADLDGKKDVFYSLQDSQIETTDVHWGATATHRDTNPRAVDIAISAMVPSGAVPGTENQNAKSGVLMVIPLKVKKAVNETIRMKFSNVEMKTQKASGPRFASEVTGVDVKNSKIADRRVELACDSSTAPVSAAVNGLVKVPVRINYNSGFTSLGLKVTYNRDKLSFHSVELSDETHLYADLSEYNRNPIESGTTGYFRLGIIASNNDIKIADGKDLVYLYFEVANNPALINTPDVVKVDVECLDNYSNVSIKGNTLMPDGVTPVSGTTPYEANLLYTNRNDRGDVNRDGKVNLIDAAYLLQYYNGIRELDAEQVSLGDVDSSGNITLMDVLKIMKKYNGEISAF